MKLIISLSTFLTAVLIVGHKKAGGVIGIVTMFLSAGVAYGKASEKIFIEMLPLFKRARFKGNLKSY